jgi:glycosyltransferase involved in cell wall biosynthesis
LYALLVRIAYVNHSRFPTEKAHGFQTAQVCDALMNLGHEVALLNPSFKNHITERAKEFYGLSQDLHSISLEHFDAFQSKIIPGQLGFIASMPSYGKSVIKYLKNNPPFDLLYIRSPYLLGEMLKSGVPVVMELHTLPGLFRGKFVHGCNACAKVVCLTRAMKSTLVSWGVNAEKIVVEGDGVDLKRFERPASASDAKKTWDLPSEKKIIGYVGSLATRETLEKGVRELIDAFAELNNQQTLLWIVGGPKKWEEVYREYARVKGLSDRHIRFEGHVDAKNVPSAISACDVCVYPAPKTNHPYFLRDTSPLKLFEYLAAGKPVVCADLPTVRDVVDESSVKFFERGNADAMAQAIDNVFSHPEEAKKRAEKGKAIAQGHSWEKRMERILAAIRP